MTAKDLAALVRMMRKKQSEFFQFKQQTTLAEAKELEKRVDAAVKSVLEPEAPDLFYEPGEDE